MACEKWDLLDGDAVLWDKHWYGGAPARAISGGSSAEDLQGPPAHPETRPIKLMPDTWAVNEARPGGEDSLTAAARELSEELGVRPPLPERTARRRLRRRNSGDSAAPAGCAARPPPAERGGRRRPLGSRGQLAESGEAPPFSSLRIPVFDFLFRSLDGVEPMSFLL